MLRRRVSGVLPAVFEHSTGKSNKIFSGGMGRLQYFYFLKCVILFENNLFCQFLCLALRWK